LVMGEKKGGQRWINATGRWYGVAACSVGCTHQWQVADEIVRQVVAC